jgi:plastocyanin
MTLTRKLTILLAALALTAFGFAACGGDDEDSGSDTVATTEETAEAPDETTAASGGSGGSASFDVSADPGGELAYDTTEATVDAGTVAINFENPSTTPHDVRIEGPDGDLGGTDVITDSSAEATVDLEPGDYTFYCSVSGHREAGMEGTLTAE